MNRQESHGGPQVAGAIMALGDGTGSNAVLPAPLAETHLLTGVSVASPTEVWVVGHTGRRPLIARWDGTTWSTPPAPPAEPQHIGAGFQGIATAPAPSETAETSDLRETQAGDPSQNIPAETGASAASGDPAGHRASTGGSAATHGLAEPGRPTATTDLPGTSAPTSAGAQAQVNGQAIVDTTAPNDTTATNDPTAANDPAEAAAPTQSSSSATPGGSPAAGGRPARSGGAHLSNGASRSDDSTPLDGVTEGTQGPRAAREPGEAVLGGSAARRPVQAIAVGGGYDRVAGTEVPLVQHWDGSAWTSWKAPEAAARGYVLTDVAMIGDGAWAVGHGIAAGGDPGPIALYWSGREWRTAGLPPVPKGRLLAVTGTAADDVWAVGATDRTGMILHFDGSGWSRMPCPKTRFPLTDVAAVSRSDAWAVGRDRVLRWNGRRWSKVKAPVTAANTVTARAPDDVWVAGGRGELAHFDGHRWTLAPSPHPLGDTAVWLASASVARGMPDGPVWVVGSYQVARADAIGGTPSITARSTDT